MSSFRNLHEYASLQMSNFDVTSTKEEDVRGVEGHLVNTFLPINQGVITIGINDTLQANIAPKV